MTDPISKPFLTALSGTKPDRTPIWLMRQAGRYLPEYRALREEAGSFLDLCFSPEKARDVTLQPLQRFDLDAAILFADILLIPELMGQKLRFETGEGPVLTPPLTEMTDITFQPEKMVNKLGPIFETVGRVKTALEPGKALIGFAGAPWTVATYMIAGRAVKDPAALRLFCYQNESLFADLIAKLEELTADYLLRQIEAGAEAVQLFDSWASGLPPVFLRQACLEPSRRIVRKIRHRYPGFPVIVFPKGAGTMLLDYADIPEFDALGLDTSINPAWAAVALPEKTVLQGGLDPLLLVTGGDALTRATQTILRAYENRPYIFNLGHGIVPQTPPENVAALIKVIRDFDKGQGK